MSRQPLSPGRRRQRAIGLALALVAAASAAASDTDQAPDLLAKGLALSLGTYVITTDSTLRLDGQTGPGTPINWGRTFGNGNVSRFRIDADWRFAERHHMTALWFNSSTTSGRTLSEQIEWGGAIFPVAATVEGTLHFAIYELDYEYALLRREDYEVGVSAGIHYTTFEAGLSGSGSIAGQSQTVSASLSRTGRVDAPLPVLGLRALWRLPQRFWLDASAQYFALKLDGVSGNLQDYRFGVLWQPYRWVGLGAGYDWFSIAANVDQQRFAGKFNWVYQGPLVYYAVHW